MSDPRFTTRPEGPSARQRAALNFIAQFRDPYLSQNPAVQGLQGAEYGPMYSRLGNIGNVLMDLYNEGGVSKGPEYFQDPDVLRQRAAMMFRKNREHPLLTAALDLNEPLDEARARRRPQQQPEGGKEKGRKSLNPYADWEFQYNPLDIVAEMVAQYKSGKPINPTMAAPPPSNYVPAVRREIGY